MNDDPDIIRWSQIKRFLKHTVCWFIGYGLIGWIGDFTRYSEASTTSHIVILIGLSLFMAVLTTQKN